MFNYTINIKKTAVKQINALPKKIKKRVLAKINDLENNPRPSGCMKLKGRKNLYRIRIGDYRIIYSVNDYELIIYIFQVGHRREIYQ